MHIKKLMKHQTDGIHNFHIVDTSSNTIHNYNYCNYFKTKIRHLFN